MPAYPDVNGMRTSYSSVEFAINGGIKLKGITAINYRDTHEIGKGRGTSAKPMWRTRGEVDFEGDIEVVREDWLEYLLPLLTKGGAYGFAETSWPVNVTYSEPSARRYTATDSLLGVRFTAPEVGLAPGTDEIRVRLTLSIMDIVWANRYRSLRTYY